MIHTFTRGTVSCHPSVPRVQLKAVHSRDASGLHKADKQYLSDQRVNRCLQILKQDSTDSDADEEATPKSESFCIHSFRNTLSRY